ncbi:DUF721 domain-containing protein [Propioniciclava tarda]|uniref:DUF721 domain-containing protein n=1 Tax=Propioniciclava tarda TaxID=433330 RepID=A0A4Q9KLX5_PROTD|nr:DUF721 domain-containing protein [Propioniciclava tarda]
MSDPSTGSPSTSSGTGTGTGTGALCSGNPAAEPVEAPTEVLFDPTGLNLAKAIAESVAHSSPLPPPKPRKAKRTRASASGRSRSDPTALGDALGELIAEQGWTTEVSVHALLGRWPSIVGDAVAQHSTPESFVAGIVTIRTDSTAWASQLRLMTPQLLAKLNAAVGEGTIKRLTIKGPDAPSWKHGIRSVRDGRGPRDTYG